MDQLYLAEDGGMCLSAIPAGDRLPYGDRILRTAGNDNPTLFRAQYELWIRKIGLRRDGVDIYILQYLRALEAEHPGLFHRNPSRSNDTNSFDEYLGITALAILFNLNHIAFEICQYGESTGWIFDNVKPDSGDVRYWRQGIDVFTYKMASLKITPAPYEFLWFVLGTFWGVLSRGTSDPLLNWTRLEALSHIDPEKLSSPICRTYWLGAMILRFVAGGILWARGGMGKITRTYFGISHPVAELANS